jgi:hypothetical protein
LGAGTPQHHTFEQGIAGQPVRAVQAGVGRLADGVEARQVAAAFEVADHAAAGVVRGRHHRNRLPGDVDAQLQATCVDGREVFLEEGLAEVPRVEPDMVDTVLLHLEVDRAGDDVAWRQFGARVVAVHEALTEALAIAVLDRQQQVRALAAQRLGDQETAFLRVVQAGRVELDELHVADAAAGTPGHRDAVAGGGVGVARVAVDLADAAGRHHHGGRGQGLDAPGVDVQGIDAIAARRLVALQVPRGDQVDRHPALAQQDVRMRPRLRQQGIVDCAAGGVGSVRDPAHRMTPLARQVQAERPLGVG